MAQRHRFSLMAATALLAAVPLAACGSGKAAGGTGGAAKSSAANSVPLASGASKLCNKAPANSHLVAALTTDQGGWPPPDAATGLSPVMFNQPGQDGWSIPGTQGGKPAIQVIPGQSTGGNDYTYTELYFTSGGAVPASSQNVLLCLEYYDGTAGADIALQYSGMNTAAPIHGAYDAAPEVYATAATNKWLVGSFTMTGINFAAGGAGIGAENGHADFRVTGENAQAFWLNKAWLVITGVPGKQALAAMPKPSAG